ncbi:MAG: hypothetical protein JWM05_3782, partial [Acidimicrobiales bacterium]|nr:hypothetical protein [Acidimicrobiales bacterium]
PDPGAPPTAVIEGEPVAAAAPEPRSRRQRRGNHTARVAVAAALLLVAFALVGSLASRSSHSGGPLRPPSTAPPAAGSGHMPADLDRALRDLEAAVQP